jgi:hypothetical protein
MGVKPDTFSANLSGKGRERGDPDPGREGLVLSLSMSLVGVY